MRRMSSSSNLFLRRTPAPAPNGKQGKGYAMNHEKKTLEDPVVSTYERDELVIETAHTIIPTS